VPTYGHYCGPGHPKHSRYDQAPVDKADAVCMDHDRCYDSMINQSTCDSAMVNSLAEVDDLEDFYGRHYIRTADTYMNAVGDGDPRTLKELLRARGKTLVAEAKLEDQVARSLGLKSYSTNKKGKGMPKQQRRKIRRVAAQAVRKELNIAPVLGGGFITRPKVRKAPKVRRSKPAFRTIISKKHQTWVSGSFGHKGGMERVTISGREMYGKMSILNAGKNVAGTIINSFLLNPTLFNDTRLKQYGHLYQRFRFKKFKVCYENSSNQFFGGQFLHYIDTDAKESYAAYDGTDQALQLASAHSDEEPAKVNKNSQVMLSASAVPQASYYMKFDPSDTQALNLSIQGKYFAFVMDPIYASAGVAPTYPLTTGRIFIEYECEMFMAALDNTTTLDADQYNGVQYVEFLSPNVIFGVDSADTASKDWFALGAFYLSGGIMPSSGTVVLPNSGILDRNQLAINVTGIGAANLTGRGLGSTLQIRTFLQQIGGVPASGNQSTISFAAGSNCT